MRKVLIGGIVGVLVLVLTAGAALAVVKTCDKVCTGTKHRDTLVGKPAVDNTISGGGKGDTINDSVGASNEKDQDTIYGGRGNDTINVREGQSSTDSADTVNCGPGKNDIVFVDSIDEHARCEQVNPDE